MTVIVEERILMFFGEVQFYEEEKHKTHERANERTPMFFGEVQFYEEKDTKRQQEKQLIIPTTTTPRREAHCKLLLLLLLPRPPFLTTATFELRISFSPLVSKCRIV
jgi:hypothetical protein